MAKNYSKILLVTSIGHVLVHAITLILPAILILLESEYQLSPIQLGTLGTAQFLPFGLSSFLAGWLVDKLGSRKILIIYFAGIFISALLIGFSQSYTQLLMGFVVLGSFSGLYHPAGLNLISRTDNLSQNMAYHGISGSIGLTLGPVIGAGIAIIFDWQTAYLFLGFISLLGLFTSVFVVNSALQIQNRIEKFHRFRISKSQITIIIVAAIWGFSHQGLFHFLPKYFSENVNTITYNSESIIENLDNDISTQNNFNNKVLKGGLLTAFVLLLGIVGQIVGGKLGAIIPRNKLLIWVIGLNIPFLILMGFTSGLLLIVVTIILGAINFTFQPVNNSLIADVTKEENRGMMYGLSMGFGFGIGSLGPKLGGYFSSNLDIYYPILGIILIPAVFISYYLWKRIDNS
jgi:MFS family permease